MTSTLCATSPSSMEYIHTRVSNRAGSPLPLIPRRAYSSSTPHIHPSAPPERISVLCTPKSIEKTETMGGCPPPHDDNATDTESNSSTVTDGTRPTIAPRARRARGYNPPLEHPPEHPGPADASSDRLRGSKVKAEAPADDLPAASRRSAAKPPKFKLDLDYLKKDDLSDSSDTPSSPSPVRTSVSAHQFHVRKKSGELVKSSLKSSKRQHRGSISVVTGGNMSKSEPATPSHSKAVHFDAQLEYVKLFLAEQRPLAVSRDGSPTDTSGTDSDFPSFIYGPPSDEERARRSLTMKVVNMPTSIRPAAEVVLEELKLSWDKVNIIGRVRVKNLAFEKKVVVRFTFDSWQTTSEVAAQFFESSQSGTFDKFVFTIRLNDMLSRIEEKTLVFAIRYSVAGRDIWDNNGRSNYIATFSKTKPKSDNGLLRPGDLTSRLEKVVKGRNESPFSPPRSTGNLKPDSLAARYDFRASLHNSSWQPRIPSPQRHLRIDTHSHPAPSNSIPWPSKGPLASSGKRLEHEPTRGSPRERGDLMVIPSTHIDRDSQDLPFNPPAARARNHHRGGDFASDTPGVKRTPPGSPIVSSTTFAHGHPPLPIIHLSPPRVHSFPPMTSESRRGGTMDIPLPRPFVEGCEENTPSVTSGSSASSSRSPSPTEAIMRAKSSSAWPSSGHDNTNYKNLLNQYCFYTGSDSLSVGPDFMPRSHSASSIEELASSSPSDSYTPPSRSSSFDDALYMSGSTTPKGTGSAGSRSPTPIAG